MQITTETKSSSGSGVTVETTSSRASGSNVDGSLKSIMKPAGGGAQTEPSTRLKERKKVISFSEDVMDR